MLETARGGILRRGVGVAHNDVAVVTNISADHLGLGGIQTLDQLAEVKATIVRITRPGGWVVLNADDPRTLAMRRLSRARPFTFGLDPDAPGLREAQTEGGRAATVLDGDLVVPDGSRVGDTEAAVRALGVQLGLGDAAIRRALEKGDSLDFERTGLYTEVFALAERKAGRTLPRAVVPTIDLQSPKFTRKLTTAWFADRVQQRYRRCVDKALSGS